MDVAVWCDDKVIPSAMQADGVTVERCTETHDGVSLVEQWARVTNTGDGPIRISRLDSISFTLPASNYELMYFKGSWGDEFTPVREPLTGDKVLYNRTGRSSQGMHPWFSIFADDGRVITGSVMWSGNWVIRFEQVPDGGFRVSAGLDDWAFSKDLVPGESMESPHVALAYGQNGDLNETSVQFVRVGRAKWYPKNAFMDTMPVEWNHWWSYEDKLITEDVFKRNVDVAAELGFDICTLDAGWFGPSEPGTDWYQLRGDWDQVNTMRFPSGIRALADYTHSKGLKFGLWCEIEALGTQALLAEKRPELVALRDGQKLGYVCLGSPAAQEWAFQTLDHLIGDYRCDWIKLDFNLDPGAGCNRTDHGHGVGDGLFEHYHGYYALLTRIRAKYPDVVLENCSSGGLRIDLGLMKHTHTVFLSDPDWSEHNLQLIWGATTMLAPNVLLRWGYSDWQHTEHRYQHFNPQDPALTPHQLDYHIRISMLCGFGFSQRLPELPDWIRERYAHHIDTYKQHVRPFITHADFYRLTAQPIRFCRGERWAAFQYSMPDNHNHLLFVFRLNGSKSEETIRMVKLERDRTYELTWLSEPHVVRYTGEQLMTNGLHFSTLREEESSLILLSY